MSEHLNDLYQKGYTVYSEFLSAEIVNNMRTDSIKWINRCMEYQVKAKLEKDYTGHHAVGDNDSIDKFIQMHFFHDILKEYFSDQKYILHACNPVLGPPSKVSYLHKIHRDIGTFISGVNLRINILVALNDFSESNGSTEIYPGSHLFDYKPTQEEFDLNKINLNVKSGTVVLFNSYLWHKAGYNQTNENRVALTLSYGPSYIKPQLDYARMLGEEFGQQLSLLSRQVLGYNSRVPISHEEWYKPKSDRLYHSDQG